MSLHLALCLSLCTIVLFCLRFKSIQGTRQSVSGRLVFHLRLIPLHKLRHARRELWYFAYRLIPVQETRQSFSAVLYTISTVLTSQRLRLYIKMRVTLHSHSFLVGVARLVSRAPCLRKCSRRNSDCCIANRVSVCFCRTTS